MTTRALASIAVLLLVVSAGCVTIVPFDQGTLMALGGQLGADVPVFVFGHAAWGEGTGDRLTAVDPPEPWYLVIHPGCAVSTARIFGNSQLTRSTPARKIAGFPGTGFKNDCETVACRLYPEIWEALAWLERNANAEARMTGTGACVFAAFEDRARAEQLEAVLPGEWTGFIARGMNRSPLQAECEKQLTDRTGASPSG